MCFHPFNECEKDVYLCFLLSVTWASVREPYPPTGGLRKCLRPCVLLFWSQHLSRSEKTAFTHMKTPLWPVIRPLTSADMTGER